MATTRALAHNTIVQFGGKIISTALGFVAFGMMTHYLGTEKFGWYTTAISFLQFVGILTDFGMTPVTAQMLSEPLVDRTKTLRNLLTFRLVTSVVALTIAPAIALFFPYPVEVKIAISFSTLSFLAIALNQVFLGWYQSKLTMHIHALGEVLGKLFLVIGIWILIYQRQSFLPIMMMVTASSILFTTVLYLAIRREASLGLAFDFDMWKKIIIKLWPISISIIFNVVYLRGDTLILPFYRPQTDIGLYGAAYRVVDVLTQSAMMLMGLFLPLLAHAWSHSHKEEFRQNYQRAFDTMMLMGLPLIVSTYILADQIILFVAPESFAAAGPILRILTLTVGGVFFGAIYGHLAVAINKQKATIWIYVSTAILTLIGYFIFIPRYGITGAAWMSVFSELYAGTLLFLLIKKHISEHLSYRLFWKLILVSIFLGATVYLLRDLSLIALIPLSLIIYAAGLSLTGAVSRHTWREIFSRKS